MFFFTLPQNQSSFTLVPLNHLSIKIKSSQKQSKNNPTHLKWLKSSVVMFPLHSGRQGAGNPLLLQHGVWSIPLARQPNVMPAHGAHIIRSVTCSWGLNTTLWVMVPLVTNLCCCCCGSANGGLFGDGIWTRWWSKYYGRLGEVFLLLSWLLDQVVVISVVVMSVLLSKQMLVFYAKWTWKYDLCDV